jgi:hypothetical protein
MSFFQFRLCASNDIMSSTTMVSSMSTFHAKVMHYIHLLLSKRNESVILSIKTIYIRLFSESCWYHIFRVLLRRIF